MKKILFFLCLVLALVFVPMSVFADGGKPLSGCRFTPIGVVVIVVQCIMLLACALSEFFESLSKKTGKGYRAANIYYLVSMWLKWFALWWYLLLYRSIENVFFWFKARSQIRHK